MIVSSHRGMGSGGSATGVAVGGTIASAGALVSGTIVGLPAGVVLAAVGGLVALGSVIAGALKIGEGCGPTCIQATQIVNQAEPTFRMNLDAYENGTIDQPTALNNFNQMWTAIQQACGGIPGEAGRKCVSDRQSGACTWKDGGQCWNWFVGYHDPLLKAANVPMQTSSVGGFDISAIPSPLLIGGVLVALGLMSGGSK